jgi:hypothetical protein
MLSSGELWGDLNGLTVVSSELDHLSWLRKLSIASNAFRLYSGTNVLNVDIRPTIDSLYTAVDRRDQLYEAQTYGEYGRAELQIETDNVNGVGLNIQTGEMVVDCVKIENL